MTLTPLLLITGLVSVITVTIALTLFLQRLTRLTRFLFLLITPILCFFWWQMPVLVNIIIDGLFFLFLYELYKVEKAPMGYFKDIDEMENGNELYERGEGVEYIDIDWQGVRM